MCCYLRADSPTRFGARAVPHSGDSLFAAESARDDRRGPIRHRAYGRLGWRTRQPRTYYGSFLSPSFLFCVICACNLWNVDFHIISPLMTFENNISSHCREKWNECNRFNIKALLVHCINVFYLKGTLVYTLNDCRKSRRRRRKMNAEFSGSDKIGANGCNEFGED